MTKSLKACCVFCKKEISNLGLPGHYNMVHLGNNNFQLAGNSSRKGKSSWNIGLTKETDIRVKDLSLKVSASLVGKALGKCSDPQKEIQRREKISKQMKLSGGGLRHGSGRGKKGWYKGFFCDSSWELAFVIYHLDKGILIEKCKEIRTYEYAGKQLKYYPDFVADGEVVEIKGFKTSQWEAKHLANPDVKVLFGSDMKFILDYVIQKYGKSFVDLYE